LKGEPLQLHLDRRRSALIVVDVQNDFCSPDGAAGRMGLDVSRVQAVVPNIVELIELARVHGLPRIYLRGEHNAWFDSPTWVARGAAGRSIHAETIPYVRSGTWGAEFYVVSPEPDELVIVKHRYSGFAFTPLELALQTLAVDTVVLAGASTHVCVEATARDAIMRGYRPLTVSDCVASGQPDLHEAALRDMAEYLGPVAMLQEVREALRSGTADDTSDNGSSDDHALRRDSPVPG
jgi:ureidoacrylate peracid hydrolase